MKNKKILIFLLGIIVLLGVGLGIFFAFKNKDSKSDEKEETKEVEKKEESKGKPLLYKVTRDGKDNVMYLFGSIHVADERAYPIRDSVMDAYNKSDALIVEFDLVAYSKNLKLQMDDMQLMLCENGKRLKDYLKPEIYDKTIQYLKDNKVYSNAYEMYKPAFIYSLLSSVAVEKSGLDSNKGIDMYFLKEAHKDNKEIIELENSTFQTNTLLSFSNDLYNYMIDEIVSNDSIEVEGLKKLYEGWLSGNVEEILESEESEEIPDDLSDDMEQYNEALMFTRNEDMMNKVKQNFEDGKNIFVVVGAAHVVGEDGLAKVLENAGYKVEKID